GRLEHGVRLADLRGHLEVPVVDRSDLDRDRTPIVLVTGLAESGHAQKQGCLTSEPVLTYLPEASSPRAPVFPEAPSWRKVGDSPGAREERTEGPLCSRKALSKAWMLHPGH